MYVTCVCHLTSPVTCT